MPMVVFDTPGLIDTRSFTIFGMNAKPNVQNPIGYFGTGLKYAIATLLRLECEVAIYVGDVQYKFFLKDIDFRGSEFKSIRMRKSKGMMSRFTYHELPFTTLLGKDWEMWMAFRELESNTRDERGQTIGVEHQKEFSPRDTDPNKTRIVVSGEAFYKTWEARHEIFLNGGKQEDPGHVIQVIATPSKHLYYRGLRVYTPPKTCLFTWNFLSHQYLTEDRTLKHQILAAGECAEYVKQSKDRDFIKKVFDAPAENYEHSFQYNLHLGGLRPSDEFMSVARTTKNYSAHGVWSGLQATVSPSKPTPIHRRIITALNNGEELTVGRLVMANKQLVIDALEMIAKARDLDPADILPTPAPAPFANLGDDVPF